MAADMALWRNISIGGSVLVVGLGGYILTKAEHEHFDKEKNAFPYMEVRAKDFPWQCSNCNLFDFKWSVSISWRSQFYA
jgi:hypothetical protein